MPRCSCARMLRILAASLLLAPLALPAAEIDDLLGQLKKVGPEGANNPDAAKAWKALVAKGPDALLPTLAAMNDDEKTVGNWLRPAVDAIAEKALADGKLSAPSLEKFLADKSRSGGARRIAYEWLVKLDKTAPDRLLPGLLQDPSAELRRDAVARFLKEGETAQEKKDDKAARAAFQKALTGASDPEQVAALAKALDQLGDKVDRQKHLGVVAHWYLVAPFDHRKGIGWDVAYPPEKAVDVTARYEGKDKAEAKWVEHTTKDPQGLVDLKKVLGPLKGTVGYAVAFVDSPAERVIEVRAGCINGLKIFLNGKEIFAREEYHHGSFIDQYRPRATLQKGKNVILLKVCQNEQEENWAQEWQFQLRLTDLVGMGVPFSSVKAPAKEDK